MTKDTRANNNEGLAPIVGALQQGAILVDNEGEVAWMDERTRRSIDGGLRALNLPIEPDGQATVDCFLSEVEVMVNGESRRLCVIQERAREIERSDLKDLIVAVEEAFADPSWFTRPLVEKMKAWRQASRPQAGRADLQLLTLREREILALLCEGRTDSEMGGILSLSQNTVRNHVASLFRKIGVNRRSAAVIWARDRAITSHDVAAMSIKRRLR